ncbi:hypothetical protein NHX12_008621 [Muraenolepis orangiensis]|uniref:Uncharacterized protein n=1 Tax=Muraenolepis orangiensis TaxID=630683 RepID=A0A9Q0DQ91_9TELE|nr:hypothetical protein NHX12_008621 [Muraenolepis orangiensis]
MMPRKWGWSGLTTDHWYQRDWTPERETGHQRERLDTRERDWTPERETGHQRERLDTGQENRDRETGYRN